MKTVARERLTCVCSVRGAGAAAGVAGSEVGRRLSLGGGAVGPAAGEIQGQADIQFLSECAEPIMI